MILLYFLSREECVPPDDPVSIFRGPVRENVISVLLVILRQNVNLGFFK